MKNCVCSGEVELDFTGCLDYKGRSYQACMISCNKCLRDVSIYFDSDAEDSNKIQEIVEETWDKINV